MLIQQATERSVPTRHTSSSQSDVSKSAGSISPTSSTTSQLTERQYFVSGVERTADDISSQQAQLTFNMSPPLSHKTASTTSPPPSTEEPFQLKSSSSSTSKDADGKIGEVSRQTEVSQLEYLQKMVDDTVMDFMDDNVNHSQTSSSTVATPGLSSDLFRPEIYFFQRFSVIC